MIEIKSWGGRVLYTAQTATDVRAAVVEAVKSGADLRGADLRGAHLSGADLSGADLSGADLSGADLRWADLRGADLRGAHLSGADLSGAHLSWAHLSGADLSGAHLSWADLRGADLRGAHLSGADLSGAHLSWAHLSGADLRGADLSGAHLSWADGVNPYLTTPLHMLKDQPGPIRAYKLVTDDYMSPIQSTGRLKYTIGKTLKRKANTDPNNACAAGINVASLDWCMREWRQGCRILLVEFTAEDIAAIPTGSDGKFRVHKVTVVGEKDLVELGLVKAEASDAI